MHTGDKILTGPAWVLDVEILSADCQSISDWLVSIMMACIDAPGFLNAELLPPSENDQNKWTLVHRFDLIDRIGQWDASSSLAMLLQQVEPLEKSNKIKISKHWHTEYTPVANVATAIVTHVKPGKSDEFRRWVTKIHNAQAKSPG